MFLITLFLTSVFLVLLYFSFFLFFIFYFFRIFMKSPGIMVNLLINLFFSFFLYLIYLTLIIILALMVSYEYTSLNIYSYLYYLPYIFNPLLFVPTYILPFSYIYLIITSLSIIYCLNYNRSEFVLFTFYTSFIIVIGFLLFFVDSFFNFFLLYECLLVPSFFILYKFAKTRRCVEASYVMFFWTQFGAFFLILFFVYLITEYRITTFSHLIFFNFMANEVSLFFILLIIGFGVKIPLWPFYMWLPKAHVEASTNFSIFLSGVLVKFAFFGLLKCMLAFSWDLTCYYIFPFLLIGIADAVLKVFYQTDLKKLIAFATVIEMHWLLICIFSGQSCLWVAGFCMLISHALLSTNSFFLVDSIMRRFKTRLIYELQGINFLCPNLFLYILLNSLVFMGFPGTLFFIAEILFFTFSFEIFPMLTILLLLLIYFLIPLFFFRIWLNTMFGRNDFFSKTLPLDLDTREILLFSFIFFLLFWFGLYWSAFIF